jgi:hypothetical protein
MSFQDQYVEATNPGLQSRVQMATSKTAQQVAAEDPATANHANRTSLATQIARSPSMYTVAFTTLLCGQAITDQSTDEEIASMVSAVWNTMAGQPPQGVNP